MSRLWIRYVLLLRCGAPHRRVPSRHACAQRPLASPLSPPPPSCLFVCSPLRCPPRCQDSAISRSRGRGSRLPLAADLVRCEAFSHHPISPSHCPRLCRVHPHPASRLRRSLCRFLVCLHSQYRSLDQSQSLFVQSLSLQSLLQSLLHDVVVSYTTFKKFTH